MVRVVMGRMFGFVLVFVLGTLSPVYNEITRLTVVYQVLLALASRIDESNHDENNYSGSRANDSLKAVFAITRHGNRGGFIDYPLDPYPLNNTHFWPNGAQQLTQVGRLQAYKLGVKLRYLYNGFLPSVFHSADIYVTSDHIDRVVMSGELILEGLYPSLDWNIRNTSGLLQPTGIFTNSSDHSQEIESCKRYVEEQRNSCSSFLVDNAANITSMFSVIFNATGVNLTAFTLASMFDKLISEDTEGYSLPRWIDKIYPDPLTDYYCTYFDAMFTRTNTMVRLLIGDMYREIIGKMQSKCNGTLAPDYKMFVYSGHDLTIASMQLALGVGSVIKPVKVGSALIIELHQDSVTSKHYVKAVYVDGSSLDSDPVTLSLPDCGDPCYLDSLVNSSLRFIKVNYNKECQTSTSESSTTANAMNPN